MAQISEKRKKVLVLIEETYLLAARLSKNKRNKKLVQKLHKGAAAIEDAVDFVDWLGKYQHGLGRN